MIGKSWCSSVNFDLWVRRRGEGEEREMEERVEAFNSLF